MKMLNKDVQVNKKYNLIMSDVLNKCNSGNKPVQIISDLQIQVKKLINQNEALTLSHTKSTSKMQDKIDLLTQKYSKLSNELKELEKNNADLKNIVKRTNSVRKEKEVECKKIQRQLTKTCMDFETTAKITKRNTVNFESFHDKMSKLNKIGRTSSIVSGLNLNPFERKNNNKNKMSKVINERKINNYHSFNSNDKYNDFNTIDEGNEIDCLDENEEIDYDLTQYFMNDCKQ
mmetsp:Transcript_91425/g.197733  ORF Transcript_91425/g.197733 Transcript_91425/m.197733 type:complete len:232 (-) Transcript_91425:25-720(-)